MAGYTIKLDIDSSKFPEVGSPMYPKSVKDAKPSRDIKDDYIELEQGAAMARGVYSSGWLGTSAVSLTKEMMSLNLGFEKDTSKTYKFLGMDIDEDYNAVIKIGSGHIVVGPMFDRDYIVNDILNSRSYVLTSSDLNVCAEMIKKISIDDVRKISTGLKTGVAYSVARSSIDDNYGEVSIAMFNDLVDSLDASLNSSGDGSLEFQSILLNLVHSKSAEQMKAKADGSNKNLSVFLLGKIMKYWTELSKQYSSHYSLLANLDLWSDMNKKMLGASEFNSRFGKCIQIMDNSTGDSEPGVISFSGIAKNGGTTDENTIRDASSQALRTCSDYLSSFTTGTFDCNVKDMLLGFVDVDGISDAYSLSVNEAQALSVLDSLQYIDEDAALCKESYDMDNPDERGLFVKSAIRSYERNFKEFKPAQHYDVTDAIADMVERGDIESAPKVIPKDTSTDDNTESDLVTGYQEDIDVKVNKKNLLRVMKLINKSTEKILKGFNIT